MAARTPIAAIKRVWERIAPLQLAERSWDNVGVLVEAPFPETRERKQVLLTIDLTPSVCAEALALPACSAVISYHPPIFRGLKSITLGDPLQASLLKLAARGISVFAPHTSLDATPNGINTWLVEPFKGNSSAIEVVTATENPPEGFEGAGMGKIVRLKVGMSLEDVVATVKKHLGLQYVQVATPNPERKVESVAVCAGSGGGVLRGVKADLLLTGEMSHHEVLACVAAGQTVILANHSNTERPYLKAVLQPWLQRELDTEGAGWEVLVSTNDADPLRTM
ncbi:hypothetical protein CcaverHIS002_0303060 [Cutaneotrichosporon cavernicola]|uniref:NGG1p interacting factor 3 n=1 Tax=Cutaneotrichosporon cavernicola TaxID=279322 RepID=A0AA48I345_9TREE|nr:uncharacterized protein CcaverHIS019_0303060 [Cutaneotrichosporon cavernicola]BEI82438.1 hypothetical protein CcaverHIS002_0303060 [Cutaneotrichosporon cavernicola]BEI90236.1 hypothetical protein CcaverHIS019_0303060 [Cutaneotrichosporon cavernicola]BEI98015.1 hypothetical protein CcaverHIS631_0303140 [Cutaneotrichosporon cavernicola]